AHQRPGITQHLFRRIARAAQRIHEVEPESLPDEHERIGPERVHGHSARSLFSAASAAGVLVPFMNWCSMSAYARTALRRMRECRETGRSRSAGGSDSSAAPMRPPCPTSPRMVWRSDRM